MKLKYKIAVTTVGNQLIAVAQGDDAVKYRNIIFLNNTGAFIFECLKTELTVDVLIKMITSKYKIDKATAFAEIKPFLQQLKDAELID